MVALVVILILGFISWLITSFIVGVICTLFGLPCNLAICTGVWLILFLLKSVFGGK